MGDQASGSDSGTTRLFAIGVANEFSSEIRVMSMLIGHAPSIDAMIAMHGTPGSATIKGVQEISGTEVHAVDLGWRQPTEGRIGRARRIAETAWRVSVSIPQLVMLARRHRSQVIYSSQQKWDCLVASVVAGVLRRPHVIHLHYIPGPWLGRFVTARLMRCRVIAVSAFIVDRLVEAGASPERVSAILNPIVPLDEADPASIAAVRAKFGLGPDDVAIGFIGRINPWKGQIELIEAMAELADEHPQAHLIIVGGGDLDFVAELQQSAARLGVTDRVIFTGYRKDVATLHGAFDIFAHPSYEDPCPLAVLEAQASGLATVAFDEGGISEIVADETSGLLAPGRSSTELAARLFRLIADRELRATMGAAAAARARAKFDPPSAGEAFGSLIATVRR